MKITIATIFIVLGFCLFSFGQEPDLAKIKAMPDDTAKVARLYKSTTFIVNISCMLFQKKKLITI